MLPATKPKLISVVTPVFNGEKFVRDAIESVLKQEGACVEYIVVDGSSIDRTMNIVQEYKDCISLIVSEPDSGMYNAINKGFARASGEILCCLNSDDTYPQGTLKKVVSCFAEGEIDLCFGDCIYVDSENRELFRYKSMDLPYACISRLGRIPFAQPAAFWTRALFDRVGGFDESYRYVADTKFFFECLRHTEARRRHVADYLARFRVHSGGFSTKAATEMENEHRRALDELHIRPGPARLVVEAMLKWKNRKNILRRLVR
jgi:glycosyltransferase involved in cell wall biosynthesis